jgi:hypothetical protein
MDVIAKMETLVILVLLTSRAAALADGEGFSNNLFSDLGP